MIANLTPCAHSFACISVRKMSISLIRNAFDLYQATNLKPMCSGIQFDCNQLHDDNDAQSDDVYGARYPEIIERSSCG